MGIKSRHWTNTIKRVFLNQWNILLFGGALAAAAMSGHADVAVPLVLAAEVMVLTASTAIPQKSETEPLHVQMERGLSANSRDQFRHIRHRCYELMSQHKIPSSRVLDKLLWDLLKLYAAVDQLDQINQITTETGVRSRLKSLERHLEIAKSENHGERIIKTLTDNIASAAVRLHNLEEAQTKRRVLVVEIGHTTDLIWAAIEALATTGSVEGLDLHLGTSTEFLDIEEDGEIPYILTEAS